jgi:broad specificity phosphatase PhoE
MRARFANRIIIEIASALSNMLFTLAHRRAFRYAALLSLCFVASGSASAEPSDALDLLTQPGHVLLLRHANAPGVGDPTGMALGECSTQRNLDDRGRAQAKGLGERLRATGVTVARVYTSQWCRCQETARLLDVGAVEELPALNSFFGQSETKESRVQALREFIDQLPRDGRAIVFVTHQMTITALSGYFPASGSGLIVKLRDGGGFEQVAELTTLE